MPACRKLCEDREFPLAKPRGRAFAPSPSPPKHGLRAFRSIPNPNTNSQNQKIEFKDIINLFYFSAMPIPQFHNLFNVTLQALHELGGTGHINAIDKKVGDILELPDTER